MILAHEGKRRPGLDQKLNALGRRMDILEALAAFLKKHPAVALATYMWQLGNKPGLYFPEKAFIRPVRTDGKVALRLEKYVEDWADQEMWNREKWTVCDDISPLSRKELAEVLKKVKVDLSNPDAYDEEGDDENFAP